MPYSASNIPPNQTRSTLNDPGPVVTQLLDPEQPTTGTLRVTLNGSTGQPQTGAQVAVLTGTDTNLTLQAETGTLLGNPAPTNQGTYINNWTPGDAAAGIQFTFTATRAASATIRIYYTALLGAGKKTVTITRPDTTTETVTVTLPVAGSGWTDFSSYVDTSVTTGIGVNTLRITSDPTAAANGFVNLDRVLITQPAATVATATIATPTPVETMLGVATAASHTVTTGSIPTTAGRTLMAVVVSATTAAAHPTINTCSGGGLTWTQQFSETGFETVGVGAAIYTATATGAPVAVTAGFTNPGSGTHRVKVYVFEIANSATVGAVDSDDSDAAAGAGATVTLTLPSTTAASSLTFAVFAMIPVTTTNITPGSGWTEILDDGESVGTYAVRIQLQRCVGTTATAVWSFTNDDYRESFGAVEFIASAAIANTAIFPNLPAGTYTLRVTTPAVQHTAPADVQVTINPDTETAVTITSAFITTPPPVTTGSVRVNVVASDGGNINGGTFTLPGYGTQTVTAGQVTWTGVEAGTYTVTQNTAASGYNVIAPFSVTVTANNETVTTVTNTATGAPPPPPPPPTGGAVLVGHTDTTQRLTAPPTAPSGSGAYIDPAGNLAAIQAALNAANPGDVIRIPAGTYNGGLTFTRSGTATNWITVRPAAGATVTFTGDTQFVHGEYGNTTNGHYTNVVGLNLNMQVNNAIEFRGGVHHVRYHANTLTNTGAQGRADLWGVFNVQPGPGHGPSGGFMPDIDRYIIIDQNVFNTVRCAPLYVWHGNRYIRFSHNWINGRGMTLGGETEAIKFGNSGRTNDPRAERANSVVMFNTVDWPNTDPYVLAPKIPNLTVIANRFIGAQGTHTRVETRYGGYHRVIGNVIESGDLALHDQYNVVAKNWIRTTASRSGLGGVVMNSSCGSGSPPNTFNRSFDDSTFYDNVIFTTSSSDAYIPFWERAEYVPVYTRPSRNTFTNNVIWKGNNVESLGASTVIAATNANPNTAAFVAANTWSGNRVGWVGGTATNPLPAGNPTITSAPAEIGAPPSTVVLTADELTVPL